MSKSDMLAVKIFQMRDCMHEYQKIHNIKRECMANAQYLSDAIKNNTIDKITIKNAIVIGYNSVTDQTVCVGGHLVIVFDNDDEQNVIDPSYDVVSLTDKRYYDNVKDFMNDIKTKDRLIFKDSIAKFIKFIPLAERMNHGELLFADKEYYHNQADYVEAKLGLIRI
jgi:hypothetical protein